MVDPKETNERTVETGSSLDQAARKVWVKPHLESIDIAVDTMAGTANTNDGAGGGSSVS